METDDYLMTVVRYIHENPLKAKVSGLDYRWSSYREYCGKAVHIHPSLVLALFGGADGFRSFHMAEHGDDGCLDVEPLPRRGLRDGDARRVADELLGEGVAASIKGASRKERDGALTALKAAGMSVRQIQRLTGVSLAVISRAGRG